MSDERRGVGGRLGAGARAVPWGAIAFLLVACSAPMPRPGDVQQTAAMADDRCGRLFAAADAAVGEAGVRDGQAVPVAGFPHLRADRLLAGFADEVATPERFAAWAERLRRLGAAGWQAELANLPPAQRTRLDRLAGGDVAAAVVACGRERLAADAAAADGRDRLRAAVRVPDDYVTAWRVLGLYPLTAIPITFGIAAWHRETAAVFATPLDELPRAGTLRRWGPPPGARLARREVAAILAASADNQLAIPEPAAADRDALFATFAPLFEVDVVDVNDRFGVPRPAAAPPPTIDVSAPTVYRHLSHARVGGRVLLQLNYVIWFPARPPGGRFDIYAGPVDGLDWRVTLDSDGTPLLYDTVHNCGCYHLLLPGPRLVPRPVPPFTEYPLLPQPAPQPAAGERVVVRLDARRHYLVRAYPDPTPVAARYAFADYDTLRSLPAPDGGGRASLFGEHGIVPGSERPERFLLWPMGIRSPGAMRQWGRHATAFVGRRHFDDPGLIEALFAYRPAGG